jgi:hypothetical protein
MGALMEQNTSSQFLIKPRLFSILIEAGSGRLPSLWRIPPVCGSDWRTGFQRFPSSMKPNAFLPLMNMSPWTQDFSVISFICGLLVVLDFLKIRTVDFFFATFLFALEDPGTHEEAHYQCRRPRRRRSKKRRNF